MIEPAPQTPGERPGRASADPLQMSLSEKLACEWEARHDVAARGRVADPAAVQHYLTHVRSEANRHPSGAGHRARTEAAAGDDDGAGVPLALRGWLRWGEERGAPDSSGLPRGC